MQVPAGGVIELSPEGFQLGSSPPLSYDDYPSLRDQVQTLLHDLVVRESLGLFGSVCGRCGNSCKRPNVVVREQDVFRLRFRLSLSEQELYDRYLVPAPSWNHGDSFIKLEDGKCPFLVEGPDDTLARCSIYEDRPVDCRQFTPNTTICRKDPGRLIQELKLIRVHPDNTLEVHLRNGRQHTLPTETAFCELIRTQVEATDKVEQRLERVARRVGELIEESDPGSDTTSIRELISDMATIGGLESTKPEILEKLWSDLRKLESSPIPARSPGRKKKKRKATRVQWVQLTEEAATAFYDLPEELQVEGQPTSIPLYLSLAQYEGLRERAQHFMRELLTTNHGEFQLRLTEPDPPCFMCGECCRCYAVEVSPSDIDRLVELIGGSPREFREKNTKPGRFTWNPGARILHKEQKVLRHTQMQPRLVPVQVSQERFERGCIFLDEREDGFFACRVYTHRPEACRGYPTTNALCRRTNQIHHWGRQARRLVWVRVEPAAVNAMVADDVMTGAPPFRFERAEYAGIDEAAVALEAEVNEVLERARKELSKQ